MVEQKDFVDLSPESGGSKGRKETVFQETEWDQIMNNPAGLTKEGILKKIENWKISSNKHVVIKYETMLARCKNIQPSQKTSEGLVVYSVINGKPVWVEDRSQKHTEPEQTRKK